MKIFIVLCFGQLISLIGSHMTGFAIGMMVYKSEQSVTLYGLVAFATLMPEIAFSAFAGILVDRWNRRTALIVGNLGAGAGTLLLIILNTWYELEIVHVIILLAISSSFNSLISPAFMAATSSLVKKEQLPQANGLIQLGVALSQIIAPAFAGFLLANYAIEGVFIVDVFSFSFAVLILMMIVIPDHKADVHNENHKTSILHELKQGWDYLVRRKSMIWLLGFNGLINFNIGMAVVLFTPLVLSFTGVEELGMVMSIAGMGMLLGAVVISIWGGLQRKIYMVFIFTFFQGLLFLSAAIQPTFLFVAIGAFLVMMTMPMINTSNQVIWQRKVAPEFQGRVFGLKATIGNIFLPLAFLLAGPLADNVFEPLMAHKGILADSLGVLIGTGEGRGVALQLMMLGCATLIIVILAYSRSSLRNMERILPDHS